VLYHTMSRGLCGPDRTPEDRPSHGGPGTGVDISFFLKKIPKLWWCIDRTGKNSSYLEYRTGKTSTY
jgi:hypothetical protein